MIGGRRLGDQLTKVVQREDFGWFKLLHYGEGRTYTKRGSEATVGAEGTMPSNNKDSRDRSKSKQTAPTEFFYLTSRVGKADATRGRHKR